VDSFDRNIYIHRTNDEENIGKPASHGCVRLTNDDVIAAYEIIPLDTPVLITED
jgi:lipoprotein-anchoring transpeptidase ErfK/SrfK